MKTIYILYRTVRTETGEYYIGVHGIDTDRYPRFNDTYLGSGIRIEAAKKKYGRKAFKRSIISISESRDIVLALETAMVTVEMIADPLCLNLAPGGRAGVAGVPSGPKSPEHRQKLSDAQKGVPNLKLKGIPKSVEHCQAISGRMKGVPKGPKSPEHRQKLSDAKKGVPTGPKSLEHRRKLSDARQEYERKRKQKNSSNLTDFIQ